MAMINAGEEKRYTHELDFTIQGMSCAACAARIEKTIGRVEGVTEVAVSFPLRTAWVQVSGGKVTKEMLAEKVGQLGFSAKLNESASEGLQRERAWLRLRLIAAVLLTLPLLAGMAMHLSWLQPVANLLPDVLFVPWLQLALATVVQFVIGMPFYFGAYYALRQRSANMDVLVVIGTTAAYLYSHYVVFRDGLFAGGSHGSPLYFETSAVVMTAVLLGKYIETSASLKAQQESVGFDELRVQTALVERGGLLTSLRTEFVRKGDIVHVGEDEFVPVDGTIQYGESALDESLLTGESAAVVKRPEDVVWAGTRNGSGKLTVITGAAGHETLLSRIQELVHQGQRAKSSLQSQVDAVASWFVPAMLITAVLTLGIWGLVVEPGNWSKASLCAIAVLLAACPCALGLAAPISLVIASGRLAKRGIVAKEAGAVERLAAIRTLVLDKTGTLTEGKPKVSFAGPLGTGRSSLLRLAVALESESSHPLADAIREEAARIGLVTPDAERISYAAGGGAEGWIHGVHAAIGNARYIENLGVALSQEARRLASERETHGETVIYVTERTNCVGIIGFRDQLKSDAAQMARELSHLGIQPIVATGDHSAPANAVAKALGIKEVYASMLPESKLALVEKLKRGGKRVAMAGDGWNDAPALAAADVGIAMGNGTYGALDAGHITLIFSRLQAITEAIRLSRLTIRNIRQNLVFALCYNAVIIPFAAIGFLQPWMAGSAMALSSVSVVANALRLGARMERAAQRSL
ncbi:heavy metal translocating P-type ATPase [Paenibacillus paeoniae]|uniref:P-type Cu(+) transporter n=1 Tax=Paenibacillus paeoniae TaxID=2292705 RepID=A0A371PK85_9BACL|nr:heavy metal translocating P-type ATPase [Paenibacillus paeoniae]REK76616.1 heavy metal translocating P-type ATPase [Paenibacillus paeoniae]